MGSGTRGIGRGLRWCESGLKTCRRCGKFRQFRGNLPLARQVHCGGVLWCHSGCGLGDGAGIGVSEA